MANVDNPRGFKPVKTLSGAPISGKIKSFPVSSSYAGTLAVGDAVLLNAGNVQRAVSGSDVLGVVAYIGSGTSNTTFGEAESFDPTDLTDPGILPGSTGGVVGVVLANDVVFEAQTDDSSTAPVVGAGLDLVATAAVAGTNTQSVMEVDHDGSPAANSGAGDAKVFEVPEFNSENLKATAPTNKNDGTSANAAVHVVFTSPTFAQV